MRRSSSATTMTAKAKKEETQGQVIKTADSSEQKKKFDTKSTTGRRGKREEGVKQNNDGSTTPNVKRIKLTKKDESHNNEEDGNDVQRSITSDTLAVTRAVVVNVVELTPKILPKILINLNTKDLISFRKVNSTWSRCTSQILMDKQSLELNFCPANMGLVTLDNPVFIGRALSELRPLNSCLARSKKMGRLDLFPCLRFEFDCVNLDTKNVQDFFNLFGANIKSLRLSHCKAIAQTKNGPVNSLVRLLTQQLVNVEELCFDSFAFIPPKNVEGFDMDQFEFNIKDSNGDNQEKLFSSLKTLKVTSSGSIQLNGRPKVFTDKIAAEIVKVAPHLSVTVINF